MFKKCSLFSHQNDVPFALSKTCAGSGNLHVQVVRIHIYLRYLTPKNRIALFHNSTGRNARKENAMLSGNFLNATQIMSNCKKYYTSYAKNGMGGGGKVKVKLALLLL